MKTTMISWTIVILSSLNYGFMAFDGFRALTIGDYIRPKTGEYAGQLGPWSKLVSAVGIDPESTSMKLIFVAFGLTGLFLTVAFGFKLDWAWKSLLILSFLSLWYLVPGTALSIIQIILLFILK
ncbi:MAG: hypothetical protein R3A50_03375 [Saprospiraceae bacterium]